MTLMTKSFAFGVTLISHLTIRLVTSRHQAIKDIPRYDMRFTETCELSHHENDAQQSIRRSVLILVAERLFDVASDRFGRIKKEAAKEVEEHASTHLREHQLQFPFQLWIHRAHVVMLAKEGIISNEEAAKILRSLHSVQTQATHNPLLSVYMNMEARVIEEAGEAGGKMHIGRSRNDLGATTQRMYVRKMILELTQDLIELWSALLAKSEEHLETVMLGYTHWQQAQPITLGHYFLAHADHCERSLSRLHSAYQFTNLNTLGAAALAGTGWPINRQLTTQLLGFDGILENTLDCVASRDYIVDVACTIAVLMTNLSRLAEDLEIWSTQEFALIELDDAYANTSSIMPQKRNPGTLETVKAHTASAIGGLTSVVSCLKNVSYTNTGDVREAVFTLRRLSEEALLSLRIMKGAVSTLRPDKALMLKRATDSYGMMTELADMIVRERNLSFRLAHEIVSTVVAAAAQGGLPSTDISSAILDDAANTVLGRPLNLPQGKVQKALDPLENVKARKTTGGPAPQEVKRMLRGRWERVAVESKRCDDRRAKLSTSIRQLNTEIETLSASRH